MTQKGEAMLRIIKIVVILFIVVTLASCKWGTDEKAVQEEPESPIIKSLKNASIPCFACHTYERFASEEPGAFSHVKHGSFGLHCNQCHAIKEHTASTVKPEACNACHKPTTFTYDASGMPATFTHEDHAKKFACDECHPKRFKTKKGATKITMDMMYQGKSCGACHNGKKAFASTECEKCHAKTSFTAVLSYTASGMPATFTHQKHAKNFMCNTCHPKLFKMKKGTTKLTMALMYDGKSCGTCHNGKKAFASTACQKCHEMKGIQKEIAYASGGVSDAIFSHTFHTSIYKCGECHTGIFKYKQGASGMKMDSIYKGRFCGHCHNGQTAFDAMKCKKCHK